MQRQPQQLPHDLIIEILLRLPVKYLVRLKCVCKSWLSLISDPLFATSHFNLVITAAPTHNQRLIFTTMYATETRSIDFEASVSDDTATASMNINFLIPRSDLKLKIGGSCRGFIFLHSHRDLYLWNPSTGIHKQIPPSPILFGLYTSFHTFLYGFGYDPLTDDYLVVLGSTDISSTAATDDSTRFEFFSLRANTWEVIKGAPYYMNVCDSRGVGILFNGAIHWLTYRNFSVKVIIAFDLTERRISETPLPNTFDIFNVPIDGDLWVFGGLMSLWAMDSDIFEIWVMKEYRLGGVSSSWTKTFVISLDDDTRFFYPICSTSSGDIVGSDSGTGLVKYNANGLLTEHRSCYNQHRSQVDSYCYNPDQSQVALYTESLLPLPLPWDTEQA